MTDFNANPPKQSQQIVFIYYDQLSDQKKLAYNIKVKLMQLEQTQTWFAQKINVDPATVTRLLAGQRRIDALELKLIATVLGCRYEELLP